jgi:hypothetical protein
MLGNHLGARVKSYLETPREIGTAPFADGCGAGAGVGSCARVGETGAAANRTANMAASRGLRQDVFIDILAFGLENTYSVQCASWSFSRDNV